MLAYSIPICSEELSMKYLKNFPFIEFITLVLLHLFLTISNLLYITFGIFGKISFRDAIPKPFYSIQEAIGICLNLQGFALLLIISLSILWLILEFSNKFSVLKLLYANKSSNFILLCCNILLLIFSLYILTFGENYGNLLWILPLFAYFSTSAGQFTIFILLWRFFDKFKDKPFAIKLRNLKKKFYAKISKRLFKAYIKNKLIRKKIVSTL